LPILLCAVFQQTRPTDQQTTRPADAGLVFLSRRCS
jgi:hypothetical protein